MEEIEKLRKENEELRELLDEYAQHLPGCTYALGEYTCRCGYNRDVLPVLDKEK